MQNTLLIAVLAGLGGMIGWGAADFFAKKTVDTVGPIKSLVWAHVSGTAVLVLVALVQQFVLGRHVALPDSAAAWGGLLFFGVLQMIVYWLTYRGFEKGQLAVLSPVFASYSGIVALVAVIAFHEHLSALLAVALVLLFGGILLVNMEPGGLRARRMAILPGLPEVGTAAVLAAIWTLGWDRFIKGQDSLSYALWMYAFMSVAAVCLAKLMKQTIGGIPKPVRPFLVGSGLGEAVAYLAISWGYSATNHVAVVAVISGAFTVPTIVLAFIFLKERLAQIQSAAIVLIVIGVIAVSLKG